MLSIFNFLSSFTRKKASFRKLTFFRTKFSLLQIKINDEGGSEKSDCM